MQIATPVAGGESGLQTDSELIDRVVSGNSSQAFAELVKRHQQALRYSLRQLTGWDEALADDLSQEVFIKAYQALPGFQKASKFSTWLYRIAYNVFISHQRKPQHRLDRYANATVPEEAEESGATGFIDNSDLHRDLAQAMQALPVPQRSALHLFLYRQCTHQEVSDIMGIPLGTAKTLINRGKTELQQRLTAWQDR